MVEFNRFNVLQVRAMVEIVKKFGWSYVSIIYEESSYGIKEVYVVAAEKGRVQILSWRYYIHCADFQILPEES
ncbi:unnamed protein product [Leptidea sinapis]|uniref:Receptor ligand binding region domain-containing protein n=1 Tax=Leptidea sinapis TaxID=189913 RepID=A0A5E4R4T0_9NEOP|nr:unnamed protein product [Leptidea sinapis]